MRVSSVPVALIFYLKRSRPRVFLRKPYRRAIYNFGPPRNSSLSTKVKRFAFKASLRCMGCDLSAVVPSASRRPRTFPAYVQAGSRTVPLVTPAFQSSGSAELQRRCSFPFGSLRLPRVPLGGSATSRTPLAAVAARGAVDNINDDNVKMLIIYCSYPAFFLKSLVCAQHFYNLMCEILL